MQVGGEFVLRDEVSRCKRCPEFIGASTSNALVTQEGAVDSPEIQQGSPSHKGTCEWTGEEISEHSSLWKDRPGICCACVFHLT